MSTRYSGKTYNTNASLTQYTRKPTSVKANTRRKQAVAANQIAQKAERVIGRQAYAKSVGGNRSARTVNQRIAERRYPIPMRWQKGEGKFFSGRSYKQSDKGMARDRKSSYVQKPFQEQVASYKDCLLFPETYMARIPFLIGNPTALCRVSSTYTFENAGRHVSVTPHAAGQKGVFGFSFSPYQILRTTWNQSSHQIEKVGYPLSWITFDADQLNTAHATGGEHGGVIGTGALFPQLPLKDMSMARIVGSSIKVQRQDCIIQQAGLAYMARTYGNKHVKTADPNKFWDHRKINPQLIRQGVFRTQKNFTNPGEVLHMTSAPLDYTDFDMTAIGEIWSNNPENPDTLYPRGPVIDGYVTGIANVDAVITQRMDVVIEFVPTQELRQVVQVSTTADDTRAREGANNIANSPAFNTLLDIGETVVGSVAPKFAGDAVSGILDKLRSKSVPLRGTALKSTGRPHQDGLDHIAGLTAQVRKGNNVDAYLKTHARLKPYIASVSSQDPGMHHLSANYREEDKPTFAKELAVQRTIPEEDLEDDSKSVVVNEEKSVEGKDALPNPEIIQIGRVREKVETSQYVAEVDLSVRKRTNSKSSNSIQPKH